MAAIYKNVAVVITVSSVSVTSRSFAEEGYFYAIIIIILLSYASKHNCKFIANIFSETVISKYP